MKTKPKTKSKGTKPLPAPDGIREMDKACDAFEAKLAEITSEVMALPLLTLAERLKQAADDLSQYGHDCRHDESTEWYYRTKSEEVYRAAAIVTWFAMKGGNK